MNKKKQKLMAVGLASFIGLGTFATTQAASVIKTLKATYNNIKITYDGVLQSPNMEPFMVDNTVYVSLRDAGQITGNAVAWENNTVKITPGASSNTTALEQQLTTKNFEIAKLQAEKNQLQLQVNTLQAELDKKEEREEENSTADLKTVLSDIRKEYEPASRYNLDIDWFIDLETNSRGDKATLILTYNTKTDQQNFENSSDSKVQSFLKDICEDISDALDVELDGEIVDEYRSATVLVDFSYSTSGRLTYNRARTQAMIDDFATDLENDYYNSLPALLNTTPNSTTTTAAPTKLITSGTPIYNLTIKETSTDTFEFVIELSLSADERSAWNATYATYLNESNLLRFMGEIADELAYEFDVDTDRITGYIGHGSTTMLRYSRNRLYPNGI